MHCFLKEVLWGYHCQTYAKCIGLHVLLFWVYLLTYTCYEGISLYISIGSIMIFVLYAPIQNRDITIKQQRHYKIISIIILLTYIMIIVSILIMACIENYEKNMTSFLSKFSLMAASGEISGASRMGAYQSSESKELQKLKKF